MIDFGFLYNFIESYWLLLGVNIFMIAALYIAAIFVSKVPVMTPGYGYRSRRSMMNVDTWKFAQELSGKLMQKYMMASAAAAIPLSIVSSLYRN